MLEKPEIQDEKIIACLQAEYGLCIAAIAFLPLGADQNTAVYRVVAADETAYFVILPSALSDRIQRETFSPKCREIVKTFMAHIETDVYADPVAAQLAAFLQSKRTEVFDLVERTERCVQALHDHSPECVLCHSDLHAGNILIEDNGAFYLVDWDAPILAPKERDLMYAGGGQFGATRTPDEEERLFYRGYGQTEIDYNALAYYRYERIVEDIAVYCEQLLLSNEGGADRAQALRYFMSNFEPNGTIEIAYRADTMLPEG